MISPREQPLRKVFGVVVSRTGNAARYAILLAADASPRSSGRPTFGAPGPN